MVWSCAPEPAAPVKANDTKDVPWLATKDPALSDPAPNEGLPEELPPGPDRMVLDEYLSSGSAEKRIMLAPSIIRGQGRTTSSGCLAIAREIFTKDLWVGHEVEVDGVIDVHVKPSSLKAAREVAGHMAAIAPGETAALLSEAPGEFRELAVADWIAGSPNLSIDQIEAFLSRLPPDQSKAASWQMVETFYHRAPERFNELPLLGDILPEEPISMWSKISQYGTLISGN